jgi:hypothetical protein
MTANGFAKAACFVINIYGALAGESIREETGKGE